MTITINPSRDEYIATAAQTVFNYTFKIFAADELAVYVTPVGDQPDDDSDLTTDYTVDPATIGDEDGGFITFNTPLTAGDAVSIVSDIPYDRTVDYQQNGDFLPSTVNSDNDRQVAQIKQVLEYAQKAVVFGQSSQNTSGLTSEVPEAGKFIRWKADESGFENVSLTGGETPEILPSNQIVYSVDNVAALTALDIETGVVVRTKGYYSENDGGAGFYIISAPQSVDGLGDHTTSNGNTAILQTARDLNLKQYGAVGDGISNDSPSIQAAFDRLVVLKGGTLVFPPANYYMGDTVVPSAGGQSALDRYTDVQNGIPVPFIGNITVIGYGAKVISDSTVFNSSFPFCMIGFVEVEGLNIKGLKFESNLNNQIADWFDPSNYFNLPVPVIKGEFASMIVGFRDVRIQDCSAEHCEGGFVLTDDRNITIPAAEPMNSYRSIIEGCRFYNCWQAISMTYGATEEMIITGNHFEYTFVKLYQESDQGRAIHFKDNTARDLAGILTNCNQVQITGNTINNFLGGISFQPQGGTDPSVSYNYDMRDVIVKDNQCYSDHATTVTSGTAQPQAFIIINATAAATAGQTVVVDNLNIEGNSAVLWPLASTSNGGFINRAGDASIQFKNIDIVDNKIDLQSGDGVIVALAPQANPAGTEFAGSINFTGNAIDRSAGNANFEFQFFSDTFNDDSIVRFNRNTIRTLGTNRQVCMTNIARLESKDNKFSLADTAIVTSAVYWLGSVRNVIIEDNEAIRLSPTSNDGYLVYFDGETSGVYDTVLDEAIVRVKDNKMSNGQFIFASAITWPASAEGFYEFIGNVIIDNTDYDSANYPTISGFTTENVVNPSKTTPSANNLVPAGYICWRMDVGVGKDTGWIWNGVWNSLGTH